MKRILIPLPSTDFDPTEVAVPWQHLRAAGHAIVIATPDGNVGTADPRMVNGTGLGVLAPVLRADRNGRAAYAQLEQSAEFRAPRAWQALQASDYDALLLPGGHAKGMREYLESGVLQRLVADFFAANKPVGAICHGVVLAARSRAADGRSVLYGRRTTALTRRMELLAWNLTRLWLDDYYRTYPQTVADEVTATLAAPGDFQQGPNSTRRDRPDDLAPGFTVKDGNYLSARWPGDAHRFARDFADLLRG